MSHPIVDVALVPAEIPESHQLGDHAVIVIDVLRATSTIVTALAAGAVSVVPVAEAGEARQLSEALGGSAVLAGERNGLPLPGFQLGNSPREYTSASVGGRVVVLTTTNGTYALRRVHGAGAVATAAFLNAAAAAEWAVNALDSGLRLTLVCAGTVRRFTWEDGSLAGLLVRMVQDRLADVEITDGARAALQVWQASGADPLAAMRLSAHGAHLTEIGFGADLEYCAQLSLYNSVPVLQNGRLTLR